MKNSGGVAVLLAAATHEKNRVCCCARQPVATKIRADFWHISLIPIWTVT
jgi:hypothetical protein